MNPLDLNKDPEIVPNEVIEQANITEVEKTPEVTVVADVVEVTEPVKKTRTPKAPKTPAAEEVVEEKSEPVIEESPEVVEETVVAEQPVEVKPIVSDHAASTKAELIETLKLVIEKEVDTVKDEVEAIKQLFYKKTKAEIEELKKVFVEENGEEAEFISPKDELEESFKSLLNTFRAKKAALMAQLEKEKETNLIQKKHILEQMKVLVDSSDDVSTHIGEFRNLQQKWKTIGQVPQTASTELWKQYNLYQESFWDLIKINNELREYDFKKNALTQVVTGNHF